MLTAFYVVFYEQLNDDDDDDVDVDTVELLRRDWSARLPVQRLVQPHQELGGCVRSAVVLRPAQRRPTAHHHQGRAPLSARRHSLSHQSQLLTQVTGNPGTSCRQ